MLALWHRAKKAAYLAQKTHGALHGALANIQSKCVYAGDKASAKGAVNGAVAVYARHRRKGRGTDQHVEMRLPPVTPTTMAAVAFAIVHDFKANRGET